MRLPRDISGLELTQSLAKLGYRVSRTTGSHQRLTTDLHGEHHITIPLHSPLRIGTLTAILAEVAEHLGTTRAEIQERLFG